ncbi:MAG: hypothetical protein AUI60_04080 [Thaumarchaeota archaeon 13_1_40CM_2_39_4]|nr:MAG: hypothetical protein AUI60_04080 [Thaumarchaeota archaeon 13_1_40CM_2_39_4]
MKIVLLTPSYYPNIGGVEVHLKEIAERLKKMVDLEIYALDHNIKSFQQTEINGVKIKRFATRNLSNEIRIPSSEFSRALSNCDADMIHLHTFHSLLPYCTLNAKYNFEHKLVITPHYHGKGHSFLRSVLFKLYKPVLGKISRKADKIICVSTYEKSLILQDFGVRNDNVVVIPNGISLGEYPADRNTCRKASKILSVGRLEKYKNFDKVIKALKLLENTDFTLSIVGDGPERSSLMNIIRQLHLEHKVSLRSNLSREELLKEYVTSSIFILPSRYEAYGIAVAEAQSLGLRTIVSNAAALSEFVDGGYAQGITLPVTPEKIAYKIIEASKGETTFNKFTPYSWDKAAQELMQLYESLA